MKPETKHNIKWAVIYGVSAMLGVLLGTLIRYAIDLIPIIWLN